MFFWFGNWGKEPVFLVHASGELPVKLGVNVAKTLGKSVG